jgi:hypothetical protein
LAACSGCGVEQSGSGDPFPRETLSDCRVTSLANEPGRNLEFTRENPQRIIHLQSSYGRLADLRSGNNHARLATQREVEMPAEQPGLEVTGVIERPYLTSPVFAGYAPRFGEVASGTAQGKVAHHGDAASRLRKNVLNMKENAAGNLE